MTDSKTKQDTVELLAGFWRELLDVDEIEPADSLIELGGNSLVATMLANRVELAWGVRPSLELLLVATFREVADWCEDARR
jgi:acyl carrier protein